MKRYDTQADDYPLFLYAGHELTNPQHYYNEIKKAIEENNPARYIMLYLIARELFDGTSPMIEIKPNELKQIKDLAKNFTDDDIPPHIANVYLAIRHLSFDAQIKEQRFYERNDNMRFNINVMIEYCKGFNLLVDKELYATITNNNPEKLKSYYDEMLKTIEKVAEQRKGVYYFYKCIYCYDIFIEMLADLLEIEELNTLKVNLFNCKEDYQATNTDMLKWYNAILEQKASDTEQPQKMADKVLNCIIKDNSKLLRPSNAAISRAIGNIKRLGIENLDKDDLIKIFMTMRA